MKLMRMLCLGSSLLGGCFERTTAAPLPAPVHVERPVAEEEIGVVRFSEQALRTLGVQRTEVVAARTRELRWASGEVIIPPGRSVVVNAPVSGELRSPRSLLPGATVQRGELLWRLLPLAPIERDLTTRTAREVSAARAELQAAEARVARLSEAGTSRAISQRALEAAIAARDVLRADVEAALRRVNAAQSAPLMSDTAMELRAPADGVVRQLGATAGQTVASGALLIELVSVDTLQVRVPVYAGDLRRLDAAVPARIHALGAQEHEWEANAVAGPPTASSERATVDRYFALPLGVALVPGERVRVALALTQETDVRSVPRPAVIYDAQGAAWIYACVGSRAFRRIRLDPSRVSDGEVFFSRGPAIGSCIAKSAVSDLFGSEFEPGH